MKNLGVLRIAKMLERKISTRNMRREDESALANYELKQARRDIARLEAELDAEKDKLADMRHRMSAAFGAIEMAEKMTGVFAKHDYKDGGGVGHCVTRRYDYKDGGGTGDYFIHQKEH